MVLTNPLLFINIKDSKTIEYIDNLLPYSIGIEWECAQKSTYDINKFKNIPNIISVNSDYSEQRYRIPNGINGLVCLYNICDQLKLNSELNNLSGIHYHIDCTEFFSYINNDLFINKFKGYILEELDTWNYKGTYNKREVSYNFSWVRLQQSFQTLEFRIGEMSFDYSLIIKRILHCSKIVSFLRKDIEECYHKDFKPVFKPVDSKKLISYLKDNLNMYKDLNKEKYEEIKIEKIQEEREQTDNVDVVKNRIIRL